jgi:two-component system, NtrC family, sensor histidine kinase HydH
MPLPCWPFRSRPPLAGPPPPFNLRRRFSVLSFAAILVVASGASLFLSRFLTQALLQRDAAVTREVIQSVAEVEHAAAFFLSPRPVRDSDATLQDFFAHIGNLPDVLRANVYGRDRTLLWSTEPRLVGQRFAPNDDLEEALRGAIAWETGITAREQHPKQEHKFLGPQAVPFVETYLPLTDPATGGVIGVVELYRIPHAVFATIATGTRRIWTAALLGGLFLFGMLYWIVARGDRLIRAQQARLVETETLAALGEMAAAVAHGLRNPLASIRSSAELALETPGAPDPAGAQDIMHAVDRLEGWVRELLTYAQPATSPLAPVHLPALVRQSVAQFTRETARRGITVAVEVPATLPPVQADAALLGQVLNSVVANALEAMPRAGTLVVQGAVAPRARRVTLAITDTGVGIPPAQLAQVFTPFHTTKPHGLGVGLALARRILRRFGGDIAIRSREGHGTTVDLQFRPAR